LGQVSYRIPGLNPSNTAGWYMGGDGYFLCSLQNE